MNLSWLVKDLEVSDTLLMFWCAKISKIWRLIENQFWLVSKNLMRATGSDLYFLNKY